MVLINGKSQISFVLQTLNEAETIIGDIRNISSSMKAVGLSYEIIVVNDASGDNTEALVKAEGVKVISHNKNKGVGAARKTGLLAAVGDIIVMTDADGTYPTREVHRLIENMVEADMVIGVTGRFKTSH